MARRRKSSYRGVHYDGRGEQPWFAVARPGEATPRRLAAFATQEDAARRYDAHVRAIGGDIRRLNFPTPEELALIRRQAPKPRPFWHGLDVEHKGRIERRTAIVRRWKAAAGERPTRTPRAVTICRLLLGAHHREGRP